MRLLQFACVQVGRRHFGSYALVWLNDALRSGDHTQHVQTCAVCQRTDWLNALDFRDAT